MDTAYLPETKSQRPLAGRTALVTGGGSGIGRALALALADAGANIGVIDINPNPDGLLATEIQSRGVRQSLVHGDVADCESIDGALSAMAGELGPVDILINNAGLIANFGGLETLPLEAWEREIAVNLTGAFLLARRLVPDMAARGWGRVVIMSSCAAWTGSPVQVGYGATKAALIGLSNTIARAYGPRGVTANAILPGFVSTPLVNAHFPPQERARVEAAVPLRRFVSPEEVAALAVFLSTPAAAGINGASIPVDGGMALSAGNIDG